MARTSIQYKISAQETDALRKFIRDVYNLPADTNVDSMLDSMSRRACFLTIRNSYQEIPPDDQSAPPDPEGTTTAAQNSDGAPRLEVGQQT